MLSQGNAILLNSFFYTLVFYNEGTVYLFRIVKKYLRESSSL